MADDIKSTNPAAGNAGKGGVNTAVGAAPVKPADQKTAGEIAQETKADLSAEAKTAQTEAHSRAAAVTDEAKDEAKKLADQAKRRAEAAASEYKERAADKGNEMAERLRAAGQEFGEGSLPDRYVGQMADSLSNAADAFARKDLGSLMADTAAFARRNPSAFIGGAALLGFAAARFLKASSPDGRYETSYASYEPRYQSHTTTAARPAPQSTAPAARPMSAPAVHAPEK